MKLCCLIVPIIKCNSCDSTFCQACAVHHANHLNDKGWAILSGRYEDALRFALLVLDARKIKLNTLYVTGK